MNMKRIFRKLHNADDAALNRMAQYPAMDRETQERLLTMSEEKCRPQVSAPSAQTSDGIIQHTRTPWMRVASAAACLAICGTTAAGIACLHRAAPVREEMQSAGIVRTETTAQPAAPTAETASVSRMKKLKKRPEAAAPAAETAAVTLPVLSAGVRPAAEQVQPETQPASAPVESVPETAPAIAASELPMQETTVTEVPSPTEPAAPAAQPPEAEWLTFDSEVEIPGFTIHKAEEGAQWVIYPNSGYTAFAQPYKPGYVPEGCVLDSEDSSQNPAQGGLRYYSAFYHLESDPGTTYDISMSTRMEHPIHFTGAAYQNECDRFYNSLSPVTVGGKPGYMHCFRTQNQDSESLHCYCVGWDNGDCYCIVTAYTFTEDDLTESILKMAESCVPAE